MIVDGQIHGGYQGISTCALLEGAVYDENAIPADQLVLYDYTMPRADDLPFEIDCQGDALPPQPLGKGEKPGRSAPPSAVVNADATLPFGIKNRKCPHAERVWRR